MSRNSNQFRRHSQTLDKVYIPLPFLKPKKNSNTPLRLLFRLFELYVYVSLFVVVHNIIGMDAKSRAVHTQIMSFQPALIMWYGTFTLLIADWMQSELLNRRRFLFAIAGMGLKGAVIFSIWIGLIALSTYIAVK
ncbi:hypothetical protein KOR42_52770 [Thalassoglobus neptunius]|uniref:Uncharacterized protein n=1 Tax=Thalassoglobus neptunius TaxID=1938619 RepID=A0A5C5VAN6_9PLAN|nr:hypothetical protein KOR42_52770 [Thalassoglobus neptunius]